MSMRVYSINELNRRLRCVASERLHQRQSLFYLVFLREFGVFKGSGCDKTFASLKSVTYLGLNIGTVD